MAKKLVLSWIPKLRQWRKRRKVGEKTKTWYLGTGNGKGDVESYNKAVAKWKAIEQSLLPTRVVDEELEAYEVGLAQMRTLGSTVSSGTGTAAAIHRYLFGDSKDTGKKVKTLAALVDEYLTAQRRRMEHGQKFPNAPRADRISPIRYISYRYNGRLMAKVWGSTPLPSSEAEMYTAMKRFRDTQQDLLTAGKLASGTFNERMKTLRHFSGWCYDNYHLPALPRNYKKLVSSYKVEPSARALDLTLIRKIWAAANGRLKTWIALGCNCGLYSVDCAYLPADAIQGDYLMVDRHKTKVPVRIKLWTITKTLLVRHAHKEGLAFTDKNGKNLYFVDVEKGVRKCKIDNQLTRLKRQLGITKVSFSNFRDTSSTKIESIDTTLTDLFDGHADARMAKWYIDHNHLDKDARFAKLDAATDELERWYDLKLETAPVTRPESQRTTTE